METFAPILISAMWPTTALVIAFIFRHEFRIIVARMARAKLPGGTELEFGVFIGDELRRTPPDSSVDPANLHLERCGNIYWLGSDIMWTYDALLRRAPGKYVLHGITQILHHLGQVGFEGIKQLNDSSATMKAQYQGLVNKYNEAVKKWNEYSTALKAEIQRLSKWKNIADADVKAAEMVRIAQATLDTAKTIGPSARMLSTVCSSAASASVTVQPATRSLSLPSLKATKVRRDVASPIATSTSLASANDRSVAGCRASATATVIRPAVASTAFSTPRTSGRCTVRVTTCPRASTPLAMTAAATSNQPSGGQRRAHQLAQILHRLPRKVPARRG